MRNFLVALLSVVFAGPSFAQVQVDPGLPEYQSTSGVSGSIKSVGSDTMNNMMALWTEGFTRFYPNVRTEIEGKGSGTAPAALIEGTANFGPMSRAMKPTEIDRFEATFGYPPIQLQTSIDMLAVYVHRSTATGDASSANPYSGQTDPGISRREWAHGAPSQARPIIVF